MRFARWNARTRHQWSVVYSVANSTMWVMSDNGFDHDGDGDEGYGNGDDVRTWRVTIAISALPATSRSAVSRLTPWPA